MNKTILILCAMEKNESRGHFLLEISSQIKVFLENDIDFYICCSQDVLINIKSEITSELFSLIRNKFIMSDTAETDFLNIIKNNKHKFKHQRIVLFFQWWSKVPIDLMVENDHELVKLNTCWITITNISAALRTKNRGQREIQFINSVLKCKSFAFAFYWDPIKSHKLLLQFNSKLIHLPEYHPENLLESNQEINKSNINSIAFFGYRSSARGVVTFIWLAMINPHIRFTLSGYNNFHDSIFFRLNRIPLVGDKIRVTVSKYFVKIYKFLPNLTEVDQYFPDQISLMHAIKKTGVIFIAGHKSPYSSGMALQCVNAHIPVLWTKGNSAHSDQMRIAYPIGELGYLYRIIPTLISLKIKKVVKTPPSINLYTYSSYKNVLLHSINKIKS
jgi:hypothetical protein